jgi:hypothetical protein
VIHDSHVSCSPQEIKCSQASGHHHHHVSSGAKSNDDIEDTSACPSFRHSNLPRTMAKFGMGVNDLHIRAIHLYVRNSVIVQGVNDKSNQCETVIGRNNDVQVLWTVTVIMQHVRGTGPIDQCSSYVKHKLKFCQVSADKWFHYIVGPCLDTLFADILQLTADISETQRVTGQSWAYIHRPLSCRPGSTGQCTRPMTGFYSVI